MTPERQRITIAEWCGWNMPTNPDWSLGLWPDYLKDLNAMHAAEAGLKGFEMILYQSELGKICTKNPHVSCWHIIHATAAQRAEALLRTIGKWED